MIQLTRALARQIRAVLRKSAPIDSGRNYRPSLALHAGPDGLQVRCHHAEVAVELHVPGPRPVDVIVLPNAALEDIEARQDTVVTLTSKDSNIVQAQWDDGGVAQSRDFDTVAIYRFPPFPAEP